MAVDQWLHNTRGIIVVVLMVATGALLLSIDPGNGFPQGASVSSGGDGGDTSATTTTVPTSTTAPAVAHPTIEEGTPNTADTTILQQKLAALGYQVTADGSFGPGTKAAVIAFQTSKGLPATGVVDAATWQALGV